MATLAANAARTYKATGADEFSSVPVIASDIIYAGAAVGDNASGYGRPLVAGDPFMGFADEQCDNSAGAAGDKDVTVRTRGRIVADVTGVTGVGDQGETVYMSDDDTFTLTSTSNTAIGKVDHFVSGTKVSIAFEAVAQRSI